MGPDPKILDSTSSTDQALLSFICSQCDINILSETSNYYDKDLSFSNPGVVKYCYIVQVICSAIHTTTSHVICSPLSMEFNKIQLVFF
jgi:hypothetical protein